ncbi:apolipoprotein N-acyltransferase [Nakamurella aerolata]|uniref:apolipoprotein N-acyltransferase n=1 Tax=Nakamurella aerolata TaxID=1656892 RepID=UPI001FE374D4|nr:apolipoprotein N-acyltransferase [Nakamurella aerolata]
MSTQSAVPATGSASPDAPPSESDQPQPGRWARARTGFLRRGWLRLLAAVAGGLATYAAYAPSEQWWTAIAGIALLGLAVHGVRGRSGYWLGAVWAASFYLPLLSWTNVYVGNLPWLALALAEALLTGLAAVLICWCMRRLPVWPVFAAAAWVAGEALQARFPFGGFPWGSLAFSQATGPLLPAASLIGSAGLVFLTALAGFALTQLAVTLARLINRRSSPAASVGAGGPHRAANPHSSASTAGDAHDRRAAVRPTALVLSVLLLAGTFAVGLLARLSMISPDEAQTYPQRTIAVIQGNVPKPGLEFNDRRRAVLNNHVNQTLQLAADVRAGRAPRPALVMWPENSSDIDPYTNPDAAAVISGAADAIGVPILIGAVVGTGQPNRTYNMGIVWYPSSRSNAGPGETYTKRHPVPFAEYMPYRSFFRLFSDKVDLVRSEFVAGTRPGNFTVDGIAFGDLICFEIVEDSLTRDVVNGGAQYLVVQTNNATFGYTNETYQQQAMSRVRAVQYGRTVLISATSGVSAVINTDGSVSGRIGLFTPGYLTPSVPLINKTTPGTVLGGPAEWLLTAAAPLALLVLWLVGRLRKRSAPAAPAQQTPAQVPGKNLNPGTPQEVSDP